MKALTGAAAAFFLASLALALALALAASSPASAQEARLPSYLGSQVCAGCHQSQAQAWDASHHALAWTQPGETTVLGDFDDAVFEFRGEVLRFGRRDGKYRIQIEEPTGKARDFDVAGVAGISPLQQYLVETAEGRLQALDVAWDVEASRWYHLYPDVELLPADGLHWGGPYKTWNARCAECHATGYEKNYDPLSRRYQSRQAEIGVGCEACHGPGEAHVAWAQAPNDYDASRWSGLMDRQFTVEFAAAAPEHEIELCAGCHSRREPFFDGNPLPGTPYHDSYRLALPSSANYYADGSILEEVYVYGSFLQSKMNARGVRCSDCHDPHAARLKAEGNAVCTQCHSPAANARFPTLQAKTYDDPSHHFHATGSPGAECKACHMIERTYMGIDGRRDHSFRIPRPDLAAETGAPDACTSCHAGRDPAWAAAELAKRYPAALGRGPHYGEVFAAARRDPAAQTAALLVLAGRAELPGILRASALDLLLPVAGEEISRSTVALLADKDPLVRVAAVALQRAAGPDQRFERLLPMLKDPLRAVRITAARELLGVPLSNLPPGDAAAVEQAMQEWRLALLAKADFPETQMMIAGTALVTRNWKAAEGAFREAVHLDPQLVEAWVMIVRILAALGDQPAARAALVDAMAANPADALLANLGAQFNPPVVRQ